MSEDAKNTSQEQDSQAADEHTAADTQAGHSQEEEVITAEAGDVVDATAAESEILSAEDAEVQEAVEAKPPREEKPDLTPAQQYEYKAEMQQLLHLIINSLYTHPEIFLRELVSNASDALNKVRFRSLSDTSILGADAALKITIELDKDNNTISIEDSGIGMQESDLVERLGTVASSGTLEFLNQIKEQGNQSIGDMIGQFGVGFYSVFMVADEVTVETRSADPGSKGFRWRSQGQGNYAITEIEKEERGTRIVVKLKESASEFSDDFRIKNIVKKYSNFVDFPIYLGDEQINTVKALWHVPKDQVKEEELSEFYKFVSNDFKDPLGHLHVSIEGSVNFKALLFVPASAPPRYYVGQHEKGVHLYSNKVFIQDDCKELLPEYLSFIKGVVDTEDLPLNVSREVTQNSPVMAKINKVITGKVLSLLEEWAKDDADKYRSFYREFGSMLAMGLQVDFGNREKITELLRYQSTRLEEGAFGSLKDYVSRMKDDQKAIYYFSGESREVMANNPNLEYFRKNDIEVLLLTDPADIITLPTVGKYAEKDIVSVEKAEIDVTDKDDKAEDALDNEAADSLIAFFKVTLGDKVEDVVASKRLVDSAVTLVVGKQGMDVHMERMMKMMDKDYAGSKKILEVNLSHPLVKNLARLREEEGKADFVADAVQHLYEGSLLLEGNLKSTSDYIARMTRFMTDATGA